MFVDAFLANYAVHADFAKASKFMVMIFQPTGLIAGGLLGGLIGQTAATRKIGKVLNTTSLSFQCESASLPGYQINTTEQKIYGAPFTQGATPIFSPLELSFICAGDLWERKFFEDWQEMILPREPKKIKLSASLDSWFSSDNSDDRPPFTAAYRNEYVSTIQVIQFNETGIPAVRYKFEEAFPVDINPQQLSWGDDSILRLNVVFHYRTYRREENILKQLREEFKVPSK